MLQRLVAMGFDLELLSSKSYNLRVLKRLSKNELREVRRIVSMHLIAEKFRKPTMKKHLLDGNLETIAKALTGRRLPYMYLIWKNPNFYDKHEPVLTMPSEKVAQPAESYDCSCMCLDTCVNLYNLIKISYVKLGTA